MSAPKRPADVEIETARMWLRRWRESDLEAFIAMNADPAVMRYFPHPYSAEESRGLCERILAEFATYGYGLYAAEETASGQFMGFIGFHRCDMDVDFCPCVEIGWRLAERFWGRGYATEGATACLERGFARLGLETVHSFTTEGNLPSQRVMEKIGMRPLRRFEHPGIPEGHPQRPHVCSIVRREDFRRSGDHFPGNSREEGNPP